MKTQEGWFRGCRHLNLFYRNWSPDTKPKAIILLVHGLAEHSGRYTKLADFLVSRGYAICSFDQQGHGRSEGQRGYVKQFSDYTSDLEIFSKMVRAENPAMKVFLMGHSVGGMIATAYVLDHAQEFAGLILSGPTLKAGSSVTYLNVLLARMLSALLPHAGITVIDASAISRDKNVVDAYVNDPLVYCGKISARLGSELIRIMAYELPSRLSKIDLPLLILHGTADRLSNPAGSSLLYECAASLDKTLKHYEGFYHEILNEPERDTVCADITRWLDAHT